jgi:hypothetical protein
MGCRITFTRLRAPRGAGGFTLVEAIIAAGIAAILVLVVCELSVFSGRSVAALYNYVDLDDDNRVAMDQITRDVRQANRVLGASTNMLVLEDGDGSILAYWHSPALRTVTRYRNGSYRVILRECDRLSFNIGQRNTVNGTYDVYPVATPDTAKVVNVSWLCSRTIFGRKENTESVQTARIVIRKQGT